MCVWGGGHGRRECEVQAVKDAEKGLLKGLKKMLDHH